MTYTIAHLDTACRLLESYNGQLPFAAFLKQYFSSNKKHGSRDRKQIGHLCYAYFRLGHAFRQLPSQERVILGLFLCAEGPDNMLAALRPEWNGFAGTGVIEKLQLAGYHAGDLTIFPWLDQLGGDIDGFSFSTSHLYQPHLYARIRPGKDRKVMDKLMMLGTKFERIGKSAIQLPNGFKLEEHFLVNTDLVVQDLSSQEVAGPMTMAAGIAQPVVSGRLKAWDCCAASGGKSILAVDTLGNIDLTVTDIRTSILANLKKRFSEAGIRNYHQFEADMATYDGAKKNFDLVIADVPCSGSGTWGRTPEQLVYFDPGSIEQFSSLQKRIAVNASRGLKPGGCLLYITCSAFRDENEGVIDWLTANTALKLQSKGYLKGYEHRADTMFAAVLCKPV
ncbi:Fmu (Sun) domain-containing protein [Flavihumibacter rivuli]|uniref:Fmu (Sun) domain-containing protein n=1 Tax=Flavihumibacter rivuli TaxID=2838156 RepID=UPI001BDEE66B|nr:Fmu (Sun) domain-containing protein [Flavihumibacter rivuli]ULQ58195.1 Fmu (Sun) domain-containing protein [Flavihumibacter rivuli]